MAENRFLSRRSEYPTALFQARSELRVRKLPSLQQRALSTWVSYGWCRRGCRCSKRYCPLACWFVDTGHMHDRQVEKVDVEILVSCAYVTMMNSLPTHSAVQGQIECPKPTKTSQSIGRVHSTSATKMSMTNIIHQKNIQPGPRGPWQLKTFSSADSSIHYWRKSHF